MARARLTTPLLESASASWSRGNLGIDLIMVPTPGRKTVLCDRIAVLLVAFVQRTHNRGEAREREHRGPPPGTLMQRQAVVLLCHIAMVEP